MSKTCDKCGINTVSCLCVPSVYESVRSKARWPIVSAALAENNVENAKARCKRHNVPTEFNAEGCPIFNSDQHRRSYCRALKSETGHEYRDKSAWF